MMSMINKVINIFRKKTKIAPINTAGIVASDNSELDIKFWKLLYDDNLTLEEENQLAKEIGNEFNLSSDFSGDEILTKSQEKALHWNYRQCVKLCHPDKFPEKDEAIARHWFNHVERLNADKNLSQMCKVQSELNSYRATGEFPPLSNT